MRPTVVAAAAALPLSLLVVLAYQLLPARFGAPLLALLLAGLAAVLVVLGRGGYAAGEDELSGLLILCLVVGAAMASTVAPMVRRRHARVGGSGPAGPRALGGLPPASRARQSRAVPPPA